MKSLENLRIGEGLTKFFIQADRLKTFLCFYRFTLVLLIVPIKLWLGGPKCRKTFAHSCLGNRLNLIFCRAKNIIKRDATAKVCNIMFNWWILQMIFCFKNFNPSCGSGGGGVILASRIHIPNLLTNYPTKLHEIKTVHEYYSQTYLSKYRCIIII